MKNQSEQINELASALCKAQALITGANKGASNPHFKSRYADLGGVLDAIREPLSVYGLSYTQMQGITDTGVTYLETRLMHSSGQWVSGFAPLKPVKNVKGQFVESDDPQAYGSYMTYMRRYSLAAIVGVAQVDDDAEGTQGRGKQAAQTVQRITPTQIKELADLIQDDAVLAEMILKGYKINSLAELPAGAFNQCVSGVQKRLAEKENG